MTMTTRDFYDQLTPSYHLIYPDWNASIEWQAAALDDIIQEFWPAGVTTILDAACGIGTQAIGLAQRGYAFGVWPARTSPKLRLRAPDKKPPCVDSTSSSQ